MRIRRRATQSRARRVLAFVLLLAVVAPPEMAAAAGQGRADWGRVRALRPGTFLQIRPLEGKSVSGRLVAADDESVTIHVGRVSVTAPGAGPGDLRVARTDVRWIKKASPAFTAGVLTAAGGSLWQLILNLRGLSKQKKEGVYVQVGMFPTLVALGGVVLALVTMPRKLYEAPPAAQR